MRMTNFTIGQHPEIQRFLDEVCGRIRAKEMHEEIRLELSTHLEELVLERLEREKHSEQQEPLNNGVLEAAIEDALKQMGDSQTIGKQLHRVHKPKTDWSLLAITAAMVGIGLLAMYTLRHFAELSPLFEKKLVYTGIGAMTMIGLYFVDYRKILRFRWLVYSIAVGLFLLAHSERFGVRMNGAEKWISIAGTTIDVASIAPYLFIIAYAGYFASEKLTFQRISKRSLAYAKELGFFYAVPAFLYATAPSLSSLAVHFFGASILLLTRKHGWMRLVLYFSSFVFMVLAMAEFRFISIRQSIFYGRFENYIRIFTGGNRQLDGSTISLENIRSAGFWGHGFNAQVGRLPYAFGENIFAYLIGSLGWAFGIALVLLVAAFVYRSICIVRQTKDPYARLLVTGLSSVIAVKFAWSMLMSFGLLPFVGVAMPLVSYNGIVHTFFEMASIGLLLSVFRRKDIIPHPRAEKLREAVQ